MLCRRFYVVHNLRGRYAAAPVGSRPVTLIHHQYGPHLPPDRSGVYPRVIDNMAVIRRRHKYRHLRRPFHLAQRDQCFRQVDCRCVHGAGAGHWIIRIGTLSSNGRVHLRLPALWNKSQRTPLKPYPMLGRTVLQLVVARDTGSHRWGWCRHQP